MGQRLLIIISLYFWNGPAVHATSITISTSTAMTSQLLATSPSANTTQSASGSSTLGPTPTFVTSSISSKSTEMSTTFSTMMSSSIYITPTKSYGSQNNSNHTKTSVIVSATHNTSTGESSSSNPRPTSTFTATNISSGITSMFTASSSNHQMTNSSLNLITTAIFSSSSSSVIPLEKRERKPLIITFTIILLEVTFVEDLENKESLTYSKIQSKVQTLMKTAHKNNVEFVSTSVAGFRLDEQTKKVLCDGRLYFTNSDINVGELSRNLTIFAENNDFSVVKFQKVDGLSKNVNDDDDDVILGLSWWQIGVIIAGLVSLVLLIAVIVIYNKLRKIKKRYMKSSMDQLYDFGNDDEMKNLRASPPGTESPDKRIETDIGENVNMESNSNKSNGNSSPRTVQTKGDGLVMDTKTRIGVENQGLQDEEDVYVTPLSTDTKSGDVVKL